MKKKPFPLLIAACAVAAVFFCVNKTSTDNNRREVAAYVRESALDVIEQKNGRKSIGKIVGEAPGSYFIKNIKGTEEKIDRPSVKNVRKASAEELEIARILLTRYTDRDPAKRMTIREKFRRAVDSAIDGIRAEAKYYGEVFTARRARNDLDRRLAEERAKERQGSGEEEGGLLKRIQDYYTGLLAKKAE